MLQIKAQTGFL